MHTPRILPFLLLLAATAALPAAAQEAEPPFRPPPPSVPGTDQPATAELLGEDLALRPGTTATLGLRLRMQPGWHVYWRNPGDSGMPPSLAWDLPEGFEAGPLQWPLPERFVDGPITTLGYADQVVLPVTVKVPDDLDAESVVLRAKATWLVCEDVCLDGEADLVLAMPVETGERRPDPRHAAAFANARSRLPRRPAKDALSAVFSGDRVRLRVVGLGPELGKAPAAIFHPWDDRQVDLGAGQAWTGGDGGRWLVMVPARAEPPARLHGVLVLDTADGEIGFTVDVPVVKDDSGTPEPPPEPPTGGD